MNREIKFRGKTLSGNWIYGLLTILTKDIDYNRKRGVYISNSLGLPFAYDVRPESVGQYIGLKDKNGVEIYDGDIVNFDKVEWGGDDNIHVVTWDKTYGCWCFGGGSILDMEFREVIGNIYENPELLEK